MSKRKNQNSILVLATLGVYFGLVLAGATPQVLAQAAMSKQFNVKDEVEVKDDLDTTPDLTAQDLDDAIESYFADLQNFVRDLRKLRGIEKFNPSFDTFDTKYVSYSPCPETGTLRGKSTESYIDRWLVPAITEANFAAEHSAWLADCITFDGFANRNKAQSAGLSLSYDKSEFTYQLSIDLKSSDRARTIYDNLISSFERFPLDKIDEEFGTLKVLYKQTQLTTTKNQVFIVTRLPRAGLDSLLAVDAK